MIEHSHTPYLISFFFLFFYCDFQLPNFFKQRKFLSQFLGIIPGDGQIYFLLSKLPSQFHPAIFLILILSPSPVVLLYSSAVSFVAVAPMLSRTSVVHHGGQWSIPSIPETTISIARPLPVLHQTQFPFF